MGLRPLKSTSIGRDIACNILKDLGALRHLHEIVCRFMPDAYYMSYLWQHQWRNRWIFPLEMRRITNFGRDTVTTKSIR